MNNKKHVEVKDFRGWLHWACTGDKEAFRWKTMNQEAWILLWMTRAYGKEEALRRFEIYTNAPNRLEYFEREEREYNRFVAKMGELLKKEEEAGYRKKSLANLSGRPKKPTLASAGAGDSAPGDQGCQTSGENGPGG